MRISIQKLRLIWNFVNLTFMTLLFISILHNPSVSKINRSVYNLVLGIASGISVRQLTEDVQILVEEGSDGK